MRNAFAMRIPLLVGRPRRETLTGTLHLLSLGRQACHLRRVARLLCFGFFGRHG